MKRVVVAIWDSAVQAYATPVFVPARGVAIRSFADAVNGEKRADDPVASHPEDFELRVLAEFEEESGIFSVPAEGVGACLARGKDVKTS